MAHNQEATQQYVDLDALKIKWVEWQDVVTWAVECEFASLEQISNLEANLCSKTKEATTAEDKRAKMEDRL